MPSDDIWQKNQQDLSQLLKDNALAPLQPLVENLQSISSAKAYPPEICRAFIELVRQMGADLRQGRSVDDVLDQAIARSGTYEQPEWDVNNVYQAGGNIIQIYLDKFRQEIEPSQPDPGISIPIVLLVMNATEAQQLASERAFCGYPAQLCADFNRLQELLNQNGFSDWVQRYGEFPEIWQPFSTPDCQKNIEQLVRHALSMIDYPKPLVPKFIDIRTLNADSNRPQLRQLRHDGCVVIIDAISMRHPVLQCEFRKSLLDAFPNTLVAMVAPIHPVLEIVQQMIVVIEQRIDLEFHRRFSVEYDDKCAEVSTHIQFSLWLKNQVAQLLPVWEKLPDGNRSFWYK